LGYIKFVLGFIPLLVKKIGTPPKKSTHPTVPVHLLEYAGILSAQFQVLRTLPELIQTTVLYTSSTLQLALGT